MFPDTYFWYIIPHIILYFPQTGWEAERQVSHNTNFRPTCVTVYVKPKDGVKGHQEEEVQEEVEETEDVEEEDAGKKGDLGPHSI